VVGEEVFAVLLVFLGVVFEENVFWVWFFVVKLW
jgi:hypothetical protein